jgi:putative NIF3 family GTP cyclohydrolase 1 type 2
LLIVHEPTFYSHYDERLEGDPVTKAKTELLERSGLTLYRYHDHPHCKAMDMICEGELKYLGLKGSFVKGPRWAVNRFALDEAISPRELARLIETRLGVKHVRVGRAADAPCSKLSLCFGTPGGVFEELQSDGVEVVLTGEACEWKLGEYARDAAQLGFKKALLIIGHVGSERDGMRLLADILTERHADFVTRYFECGEVYSYTD